MTYTPAIDDLLKIRKDDKVALLLHRFERMEESTDQRVPGYAMYPDQIMMVGFDRDTDGPPHVEFYRNQQECDRRFPQQRSQLDGRTMIHHVGSSECEVLTDIVDSFPENLRDLWIVAGRGPAKPGNEGELVYELFPTWETMTAGKPTVLDRVVEYAVVHRIGSTDYTFINIPLYMDENGIIDIEDLGLSADDFEGN